MVYPVKSIQQIHALSITALTVVNIYLFCVRLDLYMVILSNRLTLCFQVLWV